MTDVIREALEASVQVIGFRSDTLSRAVCQKIDAALAALDGAQVMYGVINLNGSVMEVFETKSEAEVMEDVDNLDLVTKVLVIPIEEKKGEE